MTLLDNSWSVFWAAAAAFGTFAAAAVAAVQIVAMKRQQKGWETLRICSAYDTDPVLDRSVCAIRNFRMENPCILDFSSIDLEICTIMNFFESIAIGIDQGLYDEHIAREHLSDIMREAKDEYFPAGVSHRIGLRPEEAYAGTFALVFRWQRKSGPQSLLLALAS